MFQANVLARVRVKVKAKVRARRKGKAEKEQMLVGAAKETHNSNSRSKAGLHLTCNSMRNSPNLRNSPPSGQTATYRKTKGIQSYLRIWGTYDPIESSPPDPKKMVVK